MPLSWNDIRPRAAAFAKAWASASDERAQAQTFWIEFFEVFGLRKPRVASFEHAVKKHGGGQGFIDLFWPGVLIVEHKSRGKSLDRAKGQALDYFPGLKERDLPRYVLVTDFARLRLDDLEAGDSIEFPLAELPKHIRRFAFVAGYRTQDIRPQDPVNRKAAERMGKLHDALESSGYKGHPLEVLLVRLLFCLFADDTGIFHSPQAFRAWIEEHTTDDGLDLGPQLTQLFQVLNTPEPDRSPLLDEALRPFPYVNGKLFAETLPMPAFDAGMRERLLEACALDWSAISPAIFGAMFQSVMDEGERRTLGAHYTSEENILKLIKPLFLDELWAEFERVKANRNKLFEFHKRLRSLHFFDPACGCGNFLVITYRELRLLELAVLRVAYDDGQRLLDVHRHIEIDVDQFHGIEIEEFPAQIAQVALWLIDHQMNLRVSDEFGAYYARIPLKASPHIVHGNALRLDWADVLAPERCSYVLGNPPFVGARQMNPAQRADANLVFLGVQNAGVLDFVACWYVKAAKYVGDAPESRTSCAFVSTSSICQGEQVGVLWQRLLALGMHIHFAHRTFSWRNEAKGRAAVHCVIVGFGREAAADTWLFEYEDPKGEPQARQVTRLNPYLVEAGDVLLERRGSPLCDAPAISYGSFALDDGHYTIGLEERASLLMESPALQNFLRPFVGGEELINGQPRWCVWLAESSPAEIRNQPLLINKIERVREWRLSSGRARTRELGATPSAFAEVRQPKTRYVAFPTVSSERRTYIPIAFLDPTVIASNQIYVIANATHFHFGVLTSAMHNAWVRTVCGRLESRYRYSAAIVYNNFPWPDPSDAHRSAIEAAAQVVLDARAAFPGSTLADLYDPLTMPPQLAKAHQKLDAAVDAAYSRRHFHGDADRVAFLFERYEQLTSAITAAASKPPRKARRKPSGAA